MKKILLTVLIIILVATSCSTVKAITVPKPAITWTDEGESVSLSKTDAVLLLNYITFLEVNNGS